MKPKVMMILAFALSLTVVVGAYGFSPAQATETQPGVAEIEIDTDTCSVLTGDYDGPSDEAAYQPVGLWVDDNADGFYGNGTDYLLGSGKTDSAGDFSFSLTAGYSGTAGLRVGDAEPDARPRQHCWWVPCIQDWVCMYL